MKVLLDTHCWLWLQVSPEVFSPPAMSILKNEENTLFLSAASSWEIAINHRLGRLPLPLPPSEYVPSRMQTSGVLGLPVEHAHALRVAELPPLHRDPFDRLLVAQAQTESMTILTADPQVWQYEVSTVRARG